MPDLTPLIADVRKRKPDRRPSLCFCGPLPYWLMVATANTPLGERVADIIRKHKPNLPLRSLCIIVITDGVPSTLSVHHFVFVLWLTKMYFQFNSWSNCQSWGAHQAGVGSRRSSKPAELPTKAKSRRSICPSWWRLKGHTIFGKPRRRQTTTR